ncbi:MAG: AzlD domain-containing protein [Actinomycetota bacterium]
MISSGELWVAVLVAAAGTYLVRTVPLLLADRIAALPAGVRRPLRMIAPAALSALVALAVMRPDGELELLSARPVAAIVAGVVGWRTGNALATIVVGMVTLIGLQAL